MKSRLLLCLFILFSGWTSLPAEIKVIQEREYFNAVQQLLAEAKNSIEVEMYLVHSNSPQVKQLLDAIIKAGARGVRVNILLQAGEEENKSAAAYLQDRGVAVEFDGLESKRHAKFILVDSRKLIIGSSNWTEKAFNENHESNVSVDVVEDKDKITILRSDYADKLLEAINKSERELDIVIYSFQFESGRENKNYEIMSALLRAYDRGVKIRIVLDSWREGESGNEPAYRLLEQAGVRVYYDLDTVATHNKLVAIDDECVLLGSANWTTSGLTENREASILIRDTSVARRYNAYVDELIAGLPEKKRGGVPVPTAFLEEGGILRKLYQKGMIQGLRLYIWLMWEAFEGESFILKRDYKRWYGAIYRTSALSWDKSKSERIRLVIHGLEKERAIGREKRGEEITLLDLADKKGCKEGECFLVPPELWTKGWIKKLSAAGIYFYFTNLAEFRKSPYKPAWINSQEKVSQEYGLPLPTFPSCVKELMRYNLIEIKHDIPDAGQPFNKRRANRYFINLLWSEEELGLKWRELTARHGQDLVLKARSMAARINDPFDPVVVADLIMLIKIYGPKAVSEAVNTATRLSFENGKWEMRYIVGILRKDHTLPQLK